MKNRFLAVTIQTSDLSTPQQSQFKIPQFSIRLENTVELGYNAIEGNE